LIKKRLQVVVLNEDVATAFFSSSIGHKKDSEKSEDVDI
jgi:hypothetical protein